MNNIMKLSLKSIEDRVASRNVMLSLTKYYPNGILLGESKRITQRIIDLISGEKNALLTQENVEIGMYYSDAKGYCFFENKEGTHEYCWISEKEQYIEQEELKKIVVQQKIIEFIALKYASDEAIFYIQEYIESAKNLPKIQDFLTALFNADPYSQNLNLNILHDMLAYNREADI